MNRAIDLYCERTGPELCSEPVNAATNLLFLLAAWMAWRYAKRLDVLTPPVWALIALLAAIGIGSGLFHTFATGWAVVLDVVPILLFELAYLWQYYRRVAAFSRMLSAVVLAAFILATGAAAPFGALLNGSLSYAPSLLFLLGTGLYHRLARRQGRNALLIAAGLFAWSLFFRTVDSAVCNVFALGTHFLWHVLNATVLYLLMRALLPNLSQPAR